MTHYLSSQYLSLRGTYPFLGLGHCVHRDRLPGDVRVEYLMSLGGIQACQIGLCTHQRPIVVRAAGEDLTGQGQRTISNAAGSSDTRTQDNALAEEHCQVPCSCSRTTG